MKNGEKEEVALRFVRYRTPTGTPTCSTSTPNSCKFLRLVCFGQKLHCGYLEEPVYRGGDISGWDGLGYSLVHPRCPLFPLGER